MRQTCKTGLRTPILAFGLGAVLLSLTALGGSQTVPEAQGRLIDFGQYHFGAVPDEFVYNATGARGPVLTAGHPFWRIYTDAFAPSPKFVLIQASTLEKPDHYPIALLREFQAADVRLGVFVKLMGGVDASAGLLWRAQDKDNYYAALASARTGQVSALVMKHGQPLALASAPCPIQVEFERMAPSPTHGWYLLEVAAQGSRHTIWFQGQKLLEVDDATLGGKGQVGLITHADTVALFDNFAVETPASGASSRIQRAARYARCRPLHYRREFQGRGFGPSTRAVAQLDRKHRRFKR